MENNIISKIVFKDNKTILYNENNNPVYIYENYNNKTLVLSRKNKQNILEKVVINQSEKSYSLDDKLMLLKKDTFSDENSKIITNIYDFKGNLIFSKSLIQTKYFIKNNYINKINSMFFINSQGIHDYNYLNIKQNDINYLNTIKDKNNVLTLKNNRLCNININNKNNDIVYSKTNVIDFTSLSNPKVCSSISYFLKNHHLKKHNSNDDFKITLEEIKIKDHNNIIIFNLNCNNEIEYTFKKGPYKLKVLNYNLYKDLYYNDTKIIDCRIKYIKNHKDEIEHKIYSKFIRMENEFFIKKDNFIYKVNKYKKTLDTINLKEEEKFIINHDGTILFKNDESYEFFIKYIRNHIVV